MKLTIKVDTGADLLPKFKYIQKAIAEALSEIALTGAMPIANEAKALCPVKTGTLRRSIITEITTSTSTRAIASIGPTVDYGIYVEFGTRHMAAQPFMRPAFDSKQGEARDAMAAIASEYIGQAIGEAFQSRK
jgi:HK97 gp10 family phage protein